MSQSYQISMKAVVLSLMVLCCLGNAQNSIFDNLPTLFDRTTHRASSADPTGGNEDNIQSFEPGATHVLLDVDGPGQITHIWTTVAAFRNHSTYLHDLVLRMYWEHSEVPSVEVPLAAFFGQWHDGILHPVESLPISVGPNPRAFNSFWPMPFYEHARIEIYNNGERGIRRIYYQVDYELGPIPEDQGLFHALFHREPKLPTQPNQGNLSGEDNYVILETEGEGIYVGCFLMVDAEGKSWWGEGDEMTFIDHSETPVLKGTGAEDYFLNAWGFDKPKSYAFYGAPFVEKRKDGSRCTVYRWHLPDPVRFAEHIRVTIEHTYDEGALNDYVSVAFWYQKKPVEDRAPLPNSGDLHPKPYLKPPKETSFELDGTELESVLRKRGVQARSITVGYGQGFRNGGYLEIGLEKESVEIPIEVPEEGTYRVEFRPVNKTIGESIKARLVGTEPVVVPKLDSQQDMDYVSLGEAVSEDKTLTLILSGSKRIGVDTLKVEKVD